MNCHSLLFGLLLSLLGACTTLPEAETESQEPAGSPQTSPGEAVDNSVTPPEDYEEYIGLTYQDTPPGLKKFAGWLIGSPEAEPVYGMSWIVDASCESQPCPPGTTSMLWFELVDVGEEASYEVIDVISLPDLPEDFSEQILSTCQQGAKSDPEIVAIVEYNSDQETLPAIQAWRANRNTEEIEAISAEGITCYNPGYGI